LFFITFTKKLQRLTFFNIFFKFLIIEELFFRPLRVVFWVLSLLHNCIIMKKIDTDLYVLSASKTAVLFGDKNGFTHPKIKKSNSDTEKYSAWGDNNLYPQEFTEKLNKTGAAIGGLEVLCSAHYGLGFRLYEDIETETGTTTRERLRTSFPEINSFFKRCRWDITLSEFRL